MCVRVYVCVCVSASQRTLEICLNVPVPAGLTGEQPPLDFYGALSSGRHAGITGTIHRAALLSAPTSAGSRHSRLVMCRTRKPRPWLVKGDCTRDSGQNPKCRYCYKLWLPPHRLQERLLRLCFPSFMSFIILEHAWVQTVERRVQRFLMCLPHPPFHPTSHTSTQWSSSYSKPILTHVSPKPVT